MALDLRLQRGLNVLGTPANDPRHSNRAGKTGLVELIQYGLGRNVRSRERFHFAPIQGSIETLWLEIGCNGRVFTIRRSLQQHSAGVTVFPVAFAPELRATLGDTLDLAKLSEFLLAQLRIPIVSVSTREGGLLPLSFSTLMRAFVLHQDDSFGAILDKVDPEGRKGDIIGLLTGIRPKEVYDLEVARGTAVSRANLLQQSFQAIRAFLASHDVTTFEEAEQRVRKAEIAVAQAVTERQREQERIRQNAAEGEAQKTSARAGAVAPSSRAGHVDDLRSRLLSVQGRRSVLEQELFGFRQEANRMQELIASLEVDEAKSRRLHVSSVVLSTFQFDVCPRCIQEVTSDMRARESYRRCSLCNRPLTVNSDVVPRTAPAADDITQQLSEARALLEEATADARATEEAVTALQAEERELAHSLDTETSAYVSPAIDALLSLSQAVSNHEAELAEARRLLRQADDVRRMEAELHLAQQRAEEADTALNNAHRSASRRLQHLEDAYRQVLMDLEFPDVTRVEIDRLSLMPYLDGTLYLHYGAALRGLAVVAYHLALLRLSLRERTNFPRLLVIDSPAVGDLNPASHDRLLRYLAAVHNGAWNEVDVTLPWQMVLTTRRSVPELRLHERMTVSAGEGRMLLRPRTEPAEKK